MRNVVLYFLAITIKVQNLAYCDSLIKYNDLKDILSSTPKYIVREQRKNYRAHSGVIPYTIYKGKAYIALGKEIDVEEWSEFGGRNKQDDPNFLATLQRELYEETAGLYMLPLEHLRSTNTYYIYRDKADKRTEVVYAFVLMQKIITAKKFKFARKHKTNKAFKEKTDIMWIDAQSLLNVIRNKRSKPRSILISSIRSKKRKIKLRKFFMIDLIYTKEIRPVLKAIIRQSMAKSNFPRAKKT